MDISFQPEDKSATIDSVLATNLNTGQKVKLSGNETLVLITTPTGVAPLQEAQKTRTVYPNPTREEANLVFSTERNQAVELRIYSVSGQLLTKNVQSLPRGIHRFLLKFPFAGVYNISVVTSDADQSFKVVYTGLTHRSVRIQYAGIEEQNSISEINQLKSGTKVTQPLPAGATLNCSEGDIIQYTVFSGANATILTGSPTGSKTYVVPFYECTDKDNNSYKTVKIGEQIWMAENLKTTKYRNGDPLLNVTDDILWEWGGLTTGAYCNYNNEENIADTYGRLYNWYAVNDSRNIAPAGWHVASDADWTTLTNFLGGKDAAGGKLKETGTTHWACTDTCATNETGFTVLPGGARQGGTFNSITFSAYWWTSSESGNPGYTWYRCISQLGNSVYRTDSYWKEGFYIRCVRDSVPPTGSLHPEADFTASKTNVSKGESIEFTDKSTNSPIGWLWDFGDGSTSTGQNPSKSYNTAGTFTVTLKATNNNGDDTKTIANYITVNETADSADTVTDIDGNVYHTVTIGTQVWMVENLKTTKYRNGYPIPNVTNNTEWAGLTTGAYCNYNNDENIAVTYGRLYNWYAVNDSRNIAPKGWHLPTDDEWTTLENFLISNGYNYDGTISGHKIAKSLAATTNWYASSNTGAIGNNLSLNNKSGFSALAGGTRYGGGIFSDIDYLGRWWSSTVNTTEFAWYWGLSCYSNNLSHSTYYKEYGFSVRCIRDSVPPTGSFPPEADFTASKTNVSKGESIEFTDKSTNSPTSWLWDFGDGSTSTGQNPSKTYNTAGTFTVSLKATNNYGDNTKKITNYITVKEPNDGEETVTDIDGNVYHTVTIGTQVWMVENLKTTKYRNGDLIPNVTGDAEWAGLTTGAYCNNNNDGSIAGTYGRLYNWYAVNDIRNIAPAGWHVASKTEWTTLTDFLGGQEVAGGKLKETGTTHWESPNTGAANQTGFTALPGGERKSVTGVNHTFWFDGKWGYWWSSHSVDADWANMWYMHHESSSCSRGISYKYCGYSVRCVRDQ